MKQKSGLVKVLSSALVLAAVSVTSSSYAFDQRLSYAACTTDFGGANDFLGGGNNGTAGTMILACPILDTASLPHASQNLIHLYYDDASTSASVMAARCLSYQNTTGGACGDTVFSSSAGTLTSNLVVPNTPAAFAANWNWGHFAYLAVYLPPRQGAALSRVKGYWMSN